MKIQARLFLGTATLVLALMCVQWWLHARQLRVLEHELGAVATTVGKGLLTGDVQFVVEKLFADTDDPPANVLEEDFVWVRSEHAVLGAACANQGSDGEGEGLQADVQVLTVPDARRVRIEHQVERVEDGAEGEQHNVLQSHAESTLNGGSRTMAVRVMTAPELATKHDIERQMEAFHSALPEIPEGARQVQIMVTEGEGEADRVLVVRADSGLESRIPIPVSPTMEVVRATLKQGLAFSGALLVLGLVASAAMARQVARPLQDLAARVDSVGAGGQVAHVDETAGGEVGNLQRSFNQMSRRLSVLESEREQWRQREHLAQLGDLSRGLAHTLRNPLNTLGLAIEELATDPPAASSDGRAHLVTDARTQIRRIDRWLRSFLALGAGHAAEATARDMGELLQATVLEAVQEDGDVCLDGGDEQLSVVVVETAIRAALGNLLENAVAASPEGEKVQVSLLREGDDAVVKIVDRGPGLPDEVRERLFSPHVTTKAGGSGMGLFLARQLIVGMHSGELELADADGGGTVAVVRLPLAETGTSP